MRHRTGNEKTDYGSESQSKETNLENERGSLNMTFSDSFSSSVCFHPGIYFAAVPFIATVVAIYIFGAGWKELVLLVLWYIPPVSLAYFSPPFLSFSGIFLIFSNLTIGLYVANSFSFSPIVKMVYTGATLFFGAGRGISLLCNEQARRGSFAFRLAYEFSFHDFSRSRIVRSKSDYEIEKLEILSQFVKAGILTISCSLALYLLAESQQLIYLAGKSFLSVGAFFFALDLTCASYRFLALCCAFSVATAVVMTPLNLQALSASSLAEFWGKRWDTGLQPVLYYNGYYPCRSLGFSKNIATFTTFCLSGIGHCCLFQALGATNFNLFLMLLFFVVQPLLLLLERKAWNLFSLPKRKFFVISGLLATPLFGLPLVQVIEDSIAVM